MKTILAGSRTLKNPAVIEQAVKASKFKITELVSGAANGADKLGEDWAEDNDIPVTQFPAEWDNIRAEGAKVKTNKFGKPYNCVAGFQRNEKMAQYADALIAIFHKAETPGTADMIERAKKHGLKIYVHWC